MGKTSDHKSILSYELLIGFIFILSISYVFSGESPAWEEHAPKSIHGEP